jgi:AcrR family transcriptional regulator
VAGRQDFGEQFCILNLYGAQIRAQAAGGEAEETRQRIVEATVGLHESVGPARTTVSAVAQRAGVQRLTVYRHFPDERALLAACSGHWVAMNPAPDPAPWRGIRDPEERLAEALGEIYAFYGRTEPMMANLVRDAPKMPVLAELLAPHQHYLVAVRDILAAGWGARGRRRELLLAALGHALDFATWRSLVRGRGSTTGGRASSWFGWCGARRGSEAGPTEARPSLCYSPTCPMRAAGESRRGWGRSRGDRRR